MREDLQTRFETIFDSSAGPSNARTSAQFRWLAVVKGLELFAQSPFTGTGPSTFAKASGYELQAHNLYAQTLSEMGLLGLISLIAMVLCFWLNSREIGRLYRSHPWWEKDFTFHVGRVAWVAVLLLLFMGAGGHNLFRYNWLWFAAFQICAVHVARRRAIAESAALWQQAHTSQVDERSYQFAPV
jgi:O-antigen ligase